MQKDFKHLGNRLVLLSVMGILVNIHLGNFLPQQRLKQNEISNNTVNVVSLLPLATPSWLTGARDDREQECRFLGICDA